MSNVWSESTHGPLTSLLVEPLLNRDFDSRPAVVYEALRNRYGPVAPVDLLGVPVWLVLGYPQALEVLEDEQGIWSKRLDQWRGRQEGLIPPGWPPLAPYEVNNSMFQDGERLKRLRAAWSAGLEPFQDHARQQARQLEFAVSRYADDLIGLMSEGGGRTGWADLSAQYARPLSLMVVNRLLGFESVPKDDGVLMDMWRMLDAGPDAAAASERLLSAFTDLASAAMERPGDDLPSYMIAANPSFTVDELARELTMVVGFVGDITGSLISNTATEVLTGEAGARARLSSGLIKDVVDRVAMTSPPHANLTFRFPTVDVRLGQFTLMAGDPVVVSVAAAHGDPLFSGAVDSGAPQATHAHLAWGAGPHHCLGRQLATTITMIAVSRLFQSFTRLELALPADQLPWRSSPMMRGLRSLPVHFEVDRVVPPADSPAHVSDTGTHRLPVGPPRPPEQSRSALRKLLAAFRRA